MIKIRSIIVATLLAASSASATIQVFWQSPDGVLDPSGSGINATPGLLIQLLWSPTDPTASLSDANQIGNINSWGGNSVVWTSATTSVLAPVIDGTSGLVTEQAVGVSEPTLLNGYVFVRLFSVASNPGVGDYVAISQITGPGLGDMDPPAGAGTTTFITMSDNIDGDPFAGIGASGSDPRLNWVQIVPEPSVLAFLGIGAALVGIRRMRRS